MTHLSNLSWVNARLSLTLPLKPVNYWKTICASVWLLVPTGAWAEPAVDLKTAYYHVRGESVRELRHSMNAQRPKNQTHDALTVWNISWTYSWRSVDGGIILHQPKVNVSITTTLPRWTPPKDADEYLLSRWQTYIKALTVHENGHVALAVQAGRDIEQKLAALPKQTSLDALKRIVDSTGQQAIASSREREKQFDEQTQHGLKQGAQFP